MDWLSFELLSDLNPFCDHLTQQPGRSLPSSSAVSMVTRLGLGFGAGLVYFTALGSFGVLVFTYKLVSRNKSEAEAFWLRLLPRSSLVTVGFCKPKTTP